jgi:hypothetical protein
MSATCDLLAAGLRLELNHLFTERPFMHPGGRDEGWFCREHALLVGALAAMLGEKSQLCLGNLVVVVPGDFTIAMVNGAEDHVWCSVDGTPPVDASFTIRHLAATVPDVELVCPDHPERLGRFQLQYGRGRSYEELRRTQETLVPLIYYNERRLMNATFPQLLDRPFSFLLRPPRGSPNFLDLYGPHSFFRIAAHLHKLGHGQTQSVIDMRQPDAIREIVDREADGRAYVLRVLANVRGEAR